MTTFRMKLRMRLVTMLTLSAVGFGSRSAMAEGRPSTAGQDPNAVVLRSALKSADYSVRLIAVEALGELDGMESLLSYALGDPEHDVRVAAVEALRRCKGVRATALLVSVRDDRSEALDIRALAAAALIARTQGEQHGHAGR